ncbi:hypothetical protein RJ641_029906 [Dillenia turbinata]|uniref:Uncharacterized protein n=1 Tax=Dillenia turbinata TaxID=194707 RepID=A0AAN8VUN0_9MAGN
MDSEVKISIPTSQYASKSKRLFFDRRYGWVFDEWKDPSEDALAGGRGMFCILPLAKALVKQASQTVKLVASSTIKVDEKPGWPYLQTVQTNLDQRLHEFISSVQKSEFNLFALKGNLLRPSPREGSE